jgi:hypothetical protein
MHEEKTLEERTGEEQAEEEVLHLHHHQDHTGVAIHSHPLHLLHLHHLLYMAIQAIHMVQIHQILVCRRRMVITQILNARSIGYAEN